MSEPIDIVVSWSEISAYRGCPLKHWLDYRQRQPGSSGPAADLGTMWHSLQQDWYLGRQRGIPTSELASRVAARHLTWTPQSEEEEDQIAKLLWMWDGFLLNGDPFADAIVHGVEHEWRTPLPRVPGQPDHVTFYLKTICDLIVQRGARYLIVDHKSQAKHQKPEDLSREMDLEDQLGLYLYAASVNLELSGRNMVACWNYAVTTDLKKTPRPPEERFWQAWSARTDAAIARTAIEAAETAMAAYARPLRVEPPRQPDKDACRWRCSHRSACYYARDANRPVELHTPTRADQAPEGVVRLGFE